MEGRHKAALLFLENLQDHSAAQWAPGSIVAKVQSFTILPYHCFPILG